MESKEYLKKWKVIFEALFCRVVLWCFVMLANGEYLNLIYRTISSIEICTAYGNTIA